MGESRDLTIEWIASGDPRMADVHVLRHEVLMAPFGLERLDLDERTLPGSTVVIAELEGCVVGTAALVVEPGSESGCVRMVCVAHGVQGRGVGSAVMLAVEQYARELGLAFIWLHSRCTAEGFYHRVGWRTTEGPFPSGRTQVPHVRMELPLR